MIEDSSFAADASGVAQSLDSFSLIGHSGFAEDLPKGHDEFSCGFLHVRAVLAQNLSLWRKILGARVSI